MKFAVENRRTRGKTGHSATLSTTNPTWIDPGSNMGFRGEKPATNRLSHGTALQLGITSYLRPSYAQHSSQTSINKRYTLL